MPPRRSSSHTQQLAQRRPRIERACDFCRTAKQRCEPVEFGTMDCPCRRCVSLGKVCNLSRVTRSQSPSTGLGAPSSGPSRNTIGSHSAGDPVEELALSPETSIHHLLQQPESVQDPMRRWSTFMMHSQERQDSSITNILPPGQIPLQTTSILPAAPGMETYSHCFPNVAQGSNNPEPSYYPQGYFGTPDDTYMDNYATHRAGDDVPNLGYAQLDDDGSVHEQGPSGEC